MALPESFLESHIYMGEYFATGEGLTIFIVYDNYKEGIESLKKIDSYFMPCLEKLSIKEVIKNKHQMAFIKAYAPVLYAILKEEKPVPGGLNIFTKFHFNYS